LFSCYINSLPAGRPFDILARHCLHEFKCLLLKIITLTVEPVKECVDGIEVGAEPGVEMAQIPMLEIGFELIEDLIEQ
jgi:hypothetical protein